MKIAIIGANGFLGKKLVGFFSKENEVISASLHPLEGEIKLDATNFQEVKRFILNFMPDLIIDTVALSSAVECEKKPPFCKKINYLTAKNIYRMCKKRNIFLVFISSSYVFDGETGNYSEESSSFSKSQYAKYKIKAEKTVSKLSNYLILRFDILYGLDNCKVKFGTKTFDNKIEIGFPEQMRSPLFIEDAPRIISKLIEKRQKGIFHVAGPDKISSLDFIKKLSPLENPSPVIEIVDGSSWVLPSPKNSTLNISKLNSLKIKTNSIDESLKIINSKIS